MMELKAGVRLFSSVDGAAVVVVKAASPDAKLGCAGEPMAAQISPDVSPGEPPAGSDALLQIGKRYADPDHSFELLCTKAGAGPLTVDGVVLDILGAKPLPASD